jgi:predicted O-methyltransferase YrrM
MLHNAGGVVNMKPSEHPMWPSVPGWLSPEEADALYGEAQRILNQIVEVGTAMGRSAIAMALSGAVVTSIDNDKTRIDAAVQNAALCGVWFKTIVGDSRAVALDWRTPIDFLFIDGWHDAANVRADYHAWAPHVTGGSSIWFHDAHGAGWPDVQAVIDELIATGELLFDGYVGTIAKLRKGVA